MKLSNFSLRRPVAMSCLIIGLALLGLRGYMKMSVEFLPKMDIPMITIQTLYPGASPEQLETDVAKRIEDIMMTLDGLKHIQSTCMENVCVTMLEFRNEVDVDIAATDIREKLDMIAADLPEEAEDPVIQKFDINAKAVLALALTGDAPVDELYDYAANTLKDRITVVPGVAECSLIGGAEREIHVVLDRDKLAARGLSTPRVVDIVRRGVGIIPSGRIQSNGREYSVEFNSDFPDIEALNDLELLAEEGRRCYLKDVGYAAMRTAELRQKATYNGRPCVMVEVIKKGEANAVQVVEDVREAMTNLKPFLPGGMELIWVRDDGAFINATVTGAWTNVVQGIALTALILFLFLYNPRSTFVVAVTMPLTIVITLFFLQFLGYSLNTSTLISIGLSVGILVTNSIVVLEAIVKHLDDRGATPFEAARKGAAESWLPVLASAGTNVVVLFPMAVIPDVIGQFLAPLVITMIIMTVVSLFISFTLTPMLCMMILKNRETTRSRRNPVFWLEKGWNHLFNKLITAYHAFISFLEARRLVATGFLVGIAALFIVSLGLAGKIGGSFFTETDRGELTIRLEFPTYYSLDATQARVQEAEARLKRLPELKNIVTTVGKIQGVAGQASEGVYLGQVQLKFTERTERDLSIDDLLDKARDSLKGYTDCIVGVFIPTPIGGINPPIELYVMGDDLNVLDTTGLAIKQLADTDEKNRFADMDTTVRDGKPKIVAIPNRAVLADLGISPETLGMTMRGNLEGLTAGTFKRGDRNYDIVVKFEDAEGADQINQFMFPGKAGQNLLIGTLADIKTTTSPVQILRRDKRRVCKVSGNTRVPLGTALTVLTRKIEENQLLPPGYEITVAGDAERMGDSQRFLGEAALTALILVVLTLAAIMESWRQPAFILVTIPLALIGMLWALFIFGESISLFVMMSAVMLIGIVVNNAILIMDQFNTHIAEGMHRHKAMLAAATERFRPICMVTAAAVLGMLPMALSRDIGAEMRTGVGIASAGGILVSGVLTMLVIPVLYSLVTRRGKVQK
ncbi:MAG: efflux RND transporter permease subunit [Lentisphaeria bacterium]|nr:efflux RND transporter permease subunit [Lentisphaeria bacterium]